ncbi:uncharacterized protein si:ch211-153f2.3 [Engraulis encrasicolus]|uniref:uncharacterized protein si:ch211-153f2.3 n=1 Tax=Engraulis encrasicolus TaxID=184585 RepID=UPI002FD4BC0E
MNPEAAALQCEDMLSTMVLENIKNKLLHAFRSTGEREQQQRHYRGLPEEEEEEEGSGVSSSSTSTTTCCFGRNIQANEELRRAKIDGAISWIRSELLEMRSQDRQLAQTLLALNTEIQRLRRSSGFYMLPPESPEPDHLEAEPGADEPDLLDPEPVDTGPAEGAPESRGEPRPRLQMQRPELTVVVMTHPPAGQATAL